ncbi:MAG: 30S ribosomal protein S1 [Actinomycetota bacterium]|nr:30S ribosomal protein S1 [Actinomycetota bacterium]
MEDKEGKRDNSVRGRNEEIIPDYDQTIKIFDEGDIVSGRVVKVDRDEILVDIGYKSEGVIPIRELSIRPNIGPEDIQVGEEIEALVLQKEDSEGRLILSKKRADSEKAWEKIERIYEESGSVKGEVIEVVKGGLILDIGLRGFLPASLVELKRVKDLNRYVGRELECKIVEMNRTRNNVVLSRKAVLEEERKWERQKILSKLEKGQILTGKISSIVDFGAFVDLGGVDGLIHISELSWSHIDHPSEVVSVGDEVKVQVLDIDLERERISLGLKQTTEDPWKIKVGKYSAGDVVEGVISRIVPFGAFLQMDEGVEGLIHISELAEERIELPDQAVKVGDRIKAKIIDIDLERRRISLSLKQLEEGKEKKVPEKTKEVQETEAVKESEEGHAHQVEENEKRKTKDFDEGETPEPSLEAVIEEMRESRSLKKQL